MKIAVLDDYQQVAREFADFSALEADHDVRIFHEYLGDRDAVVAALAEFDVIAAMRERTVFDRATLERLPNLKFMVTTGNRNASIDMDCLKERGIPCASTGGRLQTTPELAWACSKLPRISSVPETGLSQATMTAPGRYSARILMTMEQKPYSALVGRPSEVAISCGSAPFLFCP